MNLWFVHERGAQTNMVNQDLIKNRSEENLIGVLSIADKPSTLYPPTHPPTHRQLLPLHPSPDERANSIAVE